MPRSMLRRMTMTLVVGAVLATVMGSGIRVGSAASLALNAAALTPYRTCVLSATPTTTAVVADAEVRQNTATTNYGTATTLTITSSGTSNRRAYVRFDLTACTPSIPAGATIRSATMRLYLSALPSGCRTLDIFRIGAAWTETAITWNNQPFGATINNPATVARTDSFDVGTQGGCENRTAGAYSAGVDVTTDVAAFVAGSATNHGWMVRDDVEGSAAARTVTISAKQLGTLAQVPQLLVTYVVTP
jgi:large repetitive protein